MKLYKVLDKDCRAKDGGDFDYKDYLPKGNKKGKWTPRIKNLKECSKGYHITPYWNMFLGDNTNRVFEVEVKGLIEKKEVGVIDKYVCSSLRIIEEIKPKFYERNNTGDWNTGDNNTGDNNTGDWNTGHRNTGDSNTGYRNTGDWNTGDSNTGDNNTGDNNTGDNNTGHRNTGHRNTGKWNSCDKETGFFNTKQSETIRVFNKDYSREEWENCDKPNFLYFELKSDYKKDFIESFNNTSKEDVELLLKLPNFDYEVFKEISGISKRMIMNKLKGDD
jgi:hypothetical protein